MIIPLSKKALFPYLFSSWLFFPLLFFFLPSLLSRGPMDMSVSRGAEAHFFTEFGGLI